MRMSTNQEKPGKLKGNPVKKIKSKKKGNPEMLHRLEFLQNISKSMSDNGISNLSSVYGTLMKAIGKKCVYRIDPKIKRNFCRKCSTTFTPNETCDIQINSSTHPKKYPYVNCICKNCGVTRKYILNPDHKLWDSNPDFILKIQTELQRKSEAISKPDDMETEIKEKCSIISDGCHVPSSILTENDLHVSAPS